MPTIPQLPSASVVNGPDLFVLDQQATTKSVTASLVSSYLSASLGLGTAAFVNVPIIPVNGGTGVSSPPAYSIPIAEGAADWNFYTLTNGQLLIGYANHDPVPANLQAGPNITITNAPGGITISSTGAGGGFSWTTATTSMNMVTNNGYISDSASLVTFTLPLVSQVGDVLKIRGQDSGGWAIAQNGGQSIIVGSVTSTVGGSGSVSSTQQNNALDMTCIVVNTVWEVNGLQGNVSIV